MLNVKLLKAEIVKNGMTQDEFCKKINMAHSTFIRKMRIGVVTTEEAQKMIQLLKIKNPSEIFFADELTWQVNSEQKPQKKYYGSSKIEQQRLS